LCNLKYLGEPIGHTTQLMITIGKH